MSEPLRQGFCYNCDKPWAKEDEYLKPDYKACCEFMQEVIERVKQKCLTKA